MQHEWVLERFAAVDRKDIDGFIDMLTDDHEFHFGGRPPVIGKDDARAVVLQFWSMIGRLRHDIRRVRESGDMVYVEALIQYERLDGRVVLVPCCDVIRVRDGLLCEQRAYLDQAAIFADLADGETAFAEAWIDSIEEARASLGLPADRDLQSA